MNLDKLFNMQAELDKRIVEEKGLHGQDLLDKKILALLVELGELANEVRSWKFWSKDQTPRTRVLKNPTMNDEDKVYENRVLGEYVDGLHFILSIGNEYKFTKNPSAIAIVPDNVLEQFNDLFKIVAYMHNIYKDLGYGCGVHDFYDDLLINYMNLGKLLGFTWEQIEQAYYDKNKINLERQQNGY